MSEHKFLFQEEKKSKNFQQFANQVATMILACRIVLKSRFTMRKAWRKTKTNLKVRKQRDTCTPITLIKKTILVRATKGQLGSEFL